MPVTIAKVDWFFESIKGLVSAGWAETHYATTSDAGGLNTILNAETSLPMFAARLGCLSSGYAVEAVRVSDVAKLQDSVVEYFDQADGVGTFPNPGPPNDFTEEVYDGALIRLSATQRIRRMFIMRGLPSGVVVQNQDITSQNPNWNSAIERFKNAIISAQPGATIQPVVVWQLRHVEWTDEPQRPTNIIVTPDNKGLLITLAGASATAYQKNDLIRVKSVGGAYPVNRKTWRVQLYSAGLATIQTFPGRQQIFGTPVAGASALLQRGAVSYAPLVLFQQVRGASRRTGRPFFQLRGRRSALKV